MPLGCFGGLTLKNGGQLSSIYIYIFMYIYIHVQLCISIYMILKVILHVYHNMIDLCQYEISNVRVIVTSFVCLVCCVFATANLPEIWIFFQGTCRSSMPIGFQSKVIVTPEFMQLSISQTQIIWWIQLDTCIATC